ncbi:hybrid sensor histidine kinase/response regulator transcription factor [Seonamhaeicola marinus]|uniref:histidine kinase n=1 Tax=Seonamhaeicola marinus TaxID=1912246 RepID=A0A5D0HK03_9FLAO|nr:hybrid sensor histidine kinase/response regulator transcription factor [Seonamhaeicola marinus]TYA71714.1 response regulator [Seonamhaeicola marinus]
MYKKVNSIFYLLVFATSFLFAQKAQLEYQQKLTISNGLAHNGVTSILEDSRGYVWFATYDGINLYDGYELRTIKNTIDRDVLTSNRVRSLAEDSNGNIWIGTDDGITIYHYNTQFYSKLYSNELNHKLLGGPIIRDILISDDGKDIFCATEGHGILLFNENYELVDSFLPKKLKEEFIIYKGEAIDNSNYLFSTSAGLYLLNSSSKKLKKILGKDIKDTIYLERFNDNTVLVSLNGGGVAIVGFELRNNKYDFNLKEITLKEHKVKTMLIDEAQNLWIGTLTKGLIKIHINVPLDNGNLASLRQETFNDGLSVLRIGNIISTSKKNIWVASFNEGAYEFNSYDSPFKSYDISMNAPYGLASNIANHIVPIDKDRVFMTSAYGGLTSFNVISQKFEPIKNKRLQEVAKRVSTIYVDSRKNIWFRFLGENILNRLKEGSSKMDKIRLKKFPSNETLASLRSFTEDEYGNIWIGTNNDVYKVSINDENEISGLESLNANAFFKNRPLSLVRRIYADPLKSYIWIGADSDGLYRVKNEKETELKALKIEQFTRNENDKASISGNFVTSILRLPNNELWIGTEGGGVCKTIEDGDSLKFIPFTEKNGLSNNVVKNILFDNEHNLWVATNIGLNKLDTKDFTIKKFNTYDGLPFEDFWFASHRLDNGYIILSGLDGFCYFNPNDTFREESLPKLELENFKIFNQNINPNDTINNRVLLKNRINNLEEITLKYNENVFSLDLTSLHFSNPNNHFLKYKLEPINTEWIEVPSDQNTINYNGLQHGEYELSVMASNATKEWTVPKKLKIIITPPYWQTTWAYILYFVLSVLLVYIISKVVLKIQALNHEVEIEQLEKDQVKEINAAKLKFFSNISHELKTPLTLIKGPVNNLLGEFIHRVDIKEKLQIVERQSNRISQLINQVHDFQKAEAQALKMSYSRFSFNQFIQEFAKDFEFMAQNDNKNFEVKGSGNNIIVSADKDKLEKIFNNVLSNAFKYTKAKDSISITFNSEDKDLIVAISDTGKGIDKEDLEHIFERFYQSKSFENVHASGSGIGLSFAKLLVEMHYGYISVDSELGKGTTINVRIPVVKKETAEDQPLVEKEILTAEKDFEFKSQLLEKHNPTHLMVNEAFSEAVIFYVEDNSDMRAYVSKALSKFFKLKTFHNGQQCLDAMEDEWPDIVISDIQMPELNGIDLCRTIKSDIKTSHIPVILLTALTNIDDKIQGIKDGADAYITKPFNIQHLITRTEALLGNRKQLRERFQIGIPLTKENNLNNRNDNAFLEKLYNLIEENLDNQNLDLNTFAKELYLNRTHFYQKVKALTNLTPFEVLKDYRLKKAADFLVHKKVSVNEVYAMTGFKSRTHFSKLFKEKYDITPGKYAATKLEEFNT